MTDPVNNLRVWFCITSNLFKMASAVVINVSQPYCRKGFIQTLYTAFNIDLELPHLLPPRLFRTFCFFNTISFSCLLYTLSSNGDITNHRSNNLKKEKQHRLMKWGSRVPHKLTHPIQHHSQDHISESLVLLWFNINNKYQKFY